LAEVSLVGRSLEKILQVDATPVFFGKKKESQQRPTVPTGIGNGETAAVIPEFEVEWEDTEGDSYAPATALVSNLVSKPNVDLKSLL